MSIFFQTLLGASGGVLNAPAPTPDGNDYTFQNKSWSWWTYPIFQYDSANNISYASVVNNEGSRELLMINHNTGETNSIVVNTALNAEKDEHNTASFLIEDDHILWIAPPRLDSKMWVGKVSKDLNTVIMPSTEFTTNLYIAGMSYSQLVKSNGVHFNFYRSSREEWHFLRSTDGGATWMPRRKLIQKTETNPTGWLYCINQLISGNIIKFVAYTNAHMAESGLNRIVAFTLNTATGEVICNGVSQGDAFDIQNYTPLPYNTSPSVINVADKTRLSDMAGETEITHILLIDFLDSDYSQGQYRYVKFNHNTYEVLEDINIVAHGADNGYVSYFGGAFFEKKSTGEWSGNIYLSREENGTFYAEKYTYNNGSFSKTEDIDSVVRNPGDNIIMRPMPPMDSVLGGVKVWYAKGDWLNDSFTDWNTEAIAKT